MGSYQGTTDPLGIPDNKDMKGEPGLEGGFCTVGSKGDVGDQGHKVG